MSLKHGRLSAGRKNKKVSENTVDHSLVVIVLALLAFGLVMVFSASSASAHYIQGDATYFFKRQLLWAVLGLISMFVMSKIPYKILYRYTNLIFTVSVVLLLLVPLIGKEVNGAKRWLGIGSAVFQPSEIAKLSIILFLAKSISRNPDSVHKFKDGFLKYMAIIVVLAGIVLLEPHMSGAMVIGLVGCAVLFVAGFKGIYFGLMGSCAIPAIIALAVLSPYRLKRVTSFLHPFEDKLGDSWQIVQSLYAIGSGGLFGLGLGQSRQKFLYIPEPQTDFIYAIICEELGFVGAVLVILLFAILVWKGILIARKAPDTFSSLTVSGITALIAIQVLLNIAVVTSTMPVTGIPLPFFSYGGTSLLFLLTEVGIVLNISRYTSK